MRSSGFCFFEGWERADVDIQKLIRLGNHHQVLGLLCLGCSITRLQAFMTCAITAAL